MYACMVYSYILRIKYFNNYNNFIINDNMFVLLQLYMQERSRKSNKIILFDIHLQ